MAAQTFTSFTKMALALSVAAFALPAFAETVDFNTFGTFSCGSAAVCNLSSPGGNANSEITVANNGNTATATAIGFSYTNFLAGNDSINPATGAPFDDVDVIQLNTTSTGAKAPAGPVDFTGATFVLTINQTACAGCSAPATGTLNLSGVLTGRVYVVGTDARINFSNTSVTLGGVTYSLDSNFLDLANPGHSIGMSIATAEVTPEPTFMTLTGLGFAVLGFVAYRRKRTA